METFTRLFGSLLVFVYHCFDRIVILGHIPLLTRPENIVHFFRDVHQTGAITKEVLRQRTGEYNRWVDAFARNHKIPIEWAEKGVRKEDFVRPYLQRMERRASQSKIRTTASSAGSVAVTLTITSTSATR
jgi:hypothetical protein